MLSAGVDNEQMAERKRVKEAVDAISDSASCVVQVG